MRPSDPARNRSTLGHCQGVEDPRGTGHRNEIAVRVHGDPGGRFRAAIARLVSIIGGFDLPDLEESDLTRTGDETGHQAQASGVDDGGILENLLSWLAFADRGDAASVESNPATGHHGRVIVRDWMERCIEDHQGAFLRWRGNLCGLSRGGVADGQDGQCRDGEM